MPLSKTMLASAAFECAVAGISYAQGNTYWAGLLASTSIARALAHGNYKNDSVLVRILRLPRFVATVMCSAHWSLKLIPYCNIFIWSICDSVSVASRWLTDEIIVATSNNLSARMAGATLTINGEEIVFPDSVENIDELRDVMQRVLGIISGEVETPGLTDEEFDDNTESVDLCDCTICLELDPELESVKLMSCGHSFHKCCAKGWLSNHRNCPLCRTDVVSSN